MANISVKGLDHAAVLAALYNASSARRAGAIADDPSHVMTLKEARQELKKRHHGGFIDYVMGRPIKFNTDSEQVYAHVLDEDLGEGATARAINSVRKRVAKKKTKN